MSFQLTASDPKRYSLAMILLVLTAVQTPLVFAHSDGLEEVVVTATRSERTLDDTPLREHTKDSRYSGEEHTKDSRYRREVRSGVRRALICALECLSD